MHRFKIILVLSFVAISLFGQDPVGFENEVSQLLKSIQFDSTSTHTIVFTGSSSIRGWKNINEYFPDHNIINTGFGGSQMSDLLHYINDVIINFNPVQVFIYEGDNDVVYGKSVKKIINDTKQLIQMIHKKLPDCEAVLISAKPSPSRWHLKRKYIKLNSEYEKLASQQKDVEFISMWEIMLDKNKYPKSEIFISDSLHMNAEGYKLWAREIEKYLIQN